MIRPLRLIRMVLIPVGALESLDMVSTVADILNALMAVPNLVALIVLTPVVVPLSREFFRECANA